MLKKPGHSEILEMARREVLPGNEEFRPIAKGKLVALAIIFAVGGCAILWQIYRFIFEALQSTATDKKS